MKKVLLFILICLPLCFFGCDKKNLTKLDAPQNLVVENGVITFERVANEGYYSIEINDLQILADINNSHVDIYRENDTDYFAYNAQNLFDVGEHYTIKVQACASGKMSSDIVSKTYLHHEKLLQPTNIDLTGTILGWNAVKNAESYEVEIVLPNGTSVVKNTVKNSIDLKENLRLAGEYTFKVKAITNNENLLDSAIALAKFENYVELDTPKNLTLQGLTLKAELDNRANAVMMKINNVQKIIESQNDYVQVEDGVWTFDLANLADGFNGVVDFSVLGSYNINLQAVFVTGAKNYYISSTFSQSVNYVSTRQLAAPNVEIVEVENLKIVKFSSDAIEHISGFKLEIDLGESVSTYTFDANISSFVLPEDFVSVSVTALGKEFYLDSASTTVSKN